MERKWTHVMFAGGAVVLAWLFTKIGEWGWSYLAFGGRGKSTMMVGVVATTLAVVATYIAWKNEKLFTLAGEVTSELSKVTWPSRKETQAATVIVMVTVFISALFLKIIDATWSWVTGLIYG